MSSTHRCENKIYTAEDYLFGCVNFEVPSEAVTYILACRGIVGGTPFMELEQRDKRLLLADLYVWICNGVSRMDSTSDTDNGWSHKGGGYTLTDADKERMLDAANAIYEEYDEESLLDDSVKVRVDSFGISHCDYDPFPTPHIVEYD